ncbi:MAG: TolC family protein [Saprospiraceae bacterium]
MHYLFKQWTAVFLFFIIFLNQVSAQEFNGLVQTALKNNEPLKSKNFQLESAQHQWQEAKSLYGPTLLFGVQYTVAAGGRSINLPIGDLLNPVYSSLNNLTQSNAFPMIDNVSEQFLPNNFYDARFRITQPIFYPDIAIQKKLKQESISLKEIEIKAFKRNISKEVMMAYFMVETTIRVIDIYQATDTLLMEARRVTQSLVRNGVALPTTLSRIETQQSVTNASKIEAEGNYKNATRYLEFIVGEEVYEKVFLPELPPLMLNDVFIREEILQIEQSSKMLDLAQSKEDKFYQPRIGAQLDLGSQDFNFGFEPYALLGLNVEFNLYDSKKHIHRKSSIEAEKIALVHQKSFITDQIDLQKSMAEENLKTSVQQALTYKTRVSAVDKIYKEVLAKYKEGTANYLELLDAQTQVTQIQLQYAVARQKAWSKWAEFVYASASFPIQ